MVSNLPFSGVGLVCREAVTEIDGQAFIKQKLHAILARNESLAPSNARIAISRVTAGNCCRKSPREWPPLM
jgi:hypothetical protein